MTKVVLLSDTHGCIDDRITKYLGGIDEIWHAGDIGNIDVADKLAEYARLRAVYGNIDDSVIRSEFSSHAFFEVENHRVLMLHVGGYPGKYSQDAVRLIAKYRPSLFVCGHSHILRVIYDGNFRMLTLNPGAAGVQGFHQVRTLLKFTLHAGEIKDMAVVEMGSR